MTHSNPARDEATRLLKAHGCVLIRDAKHEVWSLPNGKRFTRALTPSDSRADNNSLSDLRHALGVVTVHQEGERRERKAKVGQSEQRQWTCRPTINGALQEQLLVTGLAVESKEKRIKEQQAHIESLRKRISAQKQEISSLLTALAKEREKTAWDKAVEWAQRIMQSYRGSEEEA